MQYYSCDTSIHWFVPTPMEPSLFNRCDLMLCELLLYLHLVWVPLVPVNQSQTPQSIASTCRCTAGTGCGGKFLFNDIITHLPRARAPPATADSFEGVES